MCLMKLFGTLIVVVVSRMFTSVKIIELYISSGSSLLYVNHASKGWFKEKTKNKNKIKYPCLAKKIEKKFYLESQTGLEQAVITNSQLGDVSNSS